MKTAKLKTTCQNQSGRLYVYSQIELGKSPSDIIKEGKVSERSIWRYIRALRDNGNIEKVGLGVWKALKQPATIHLGRSKFKSIRSHAFGFYLKIIPTYKWKQRDVFLVNNNIKFKKGNLNNVYSQSFIYKKFHITLFNEGIKFLSVKEENQFKTNSATRGNELAYIKIKEVIQGLESLFDDISFKIKGKYEVKITRQHHADMKNELATIYNKEHKKLKVFDEKGEWLLIDFSLNTDELETIRGSTASSDMDNAVKPFFNSLKEKPFTAHDFEELKSNTESLAKNTKVYVENIKLHLQTLQEIREAIKELGVKTNEKGTTKKGKS